MGIKSIPADEICLLACARMLNIHISVDYYTGSWTSFESVSKDHEYILEKSDAHFIYRGSCTYNLLCKNYELKTIGRKLLDHKLYRMDLIKPLSIILEKIMDYSSNKENTQQDQSDSDTTEIYHHHDNHASTS